MQQDDRVGALPGRVPDVQLLDLLVGQARAAVRADQQPVLPRRRRGPSGVVLQGVDLADAGVEEEHQRRRTATTTTSSTSSVRCAATDPTGRAAAGAASSGVRRPGRWQEAAYAGRRRRRSTGAPPGLGRPTASGRVAWVGSAGRADHLGGLVGAGSAGQPRGAGPAGAPPRSQPSGQLLMSASLHRPYPCRSCPTPRPPPPSSAPRRSRAVSGITAGRPTSAARSTLSRIMTVLDTNLLGTVHGGVVMKLVDDVAGVVAQRHSGGAAVTASMDEMDFLAPVGVGDLVHAEAQVNWTGTHLDGGRRAGARRAVERGGGRAGAGGDGVPRVRRRGRRRAARARCRRCCPRPTRTAGASPRPRSAVPTGWPVARPSRVAGQRRPWRPAPRRMWPGER